MRGRATVSGTRKRSLRPRSWTAGEGSPLPSVRTGTYLLQVRHDSATARSLAAPPLAHPPSASTCTCRVPICRPPKRASRRIVGAQPQHRLESRRREAGRPRRGAVPALAHLCRRCPLHLRPRCCASTRVCCPHPPDSCAACSGVGHTPGAPECDPNCLGESLWWGGNLMGAKHKPVRHAALCSHGFVPHKCTQPHADDVRV